MSSSATRHREPSHALPSPRRQPAASARARRIFWRRRALTVLALSLLAAFIWFAFSLGGALLNPALGSSLGSRLAEWGRAHGGATIVNWAENE